MHVVYSCCPVGAYIVPYGGREMKWRKHIFGICLFGKLNLKLFLAYGADGLISNIFFNALDLIS